MFYFRTAPPVPTSPQPLKGHCGQNSALGTTVQNHDKGSNPFRVSKHIEADKTAKMPRLESLVMDSVPSSGVVDSRSGACKTAASAKRSAARLRRGESHSRDEESEHPLEDRRRRRNKLWEQVSIKDELRQSKSTEDTVKNETEHDNMDDRLLLSHSRTTASSVATASTTYNGSTRKTNASQHQGKTRPNGTTGRHLKNWGSFRIPKRSKRTSTGKDEQDGNDMEDQNSSLTFHTSPASSPQIRTRLRTGSENRSHVEESDLGQSEQGKRCHGQRLRSSMTRHYGSDVIQHGVLASWNVSKNIIFSFDLQWKANIFIFLFCNFLLLLKLYFWVYVKNICREVSKTKQLADKEEKYILKEWNFRSGEIYWPNF